MPHLATRRQYNAHLIKMLSCELPCIHDIFYTHTHTNMMTNMHDDDLEFFLTAAASPKQGDTNRESFIKSQQSWCLSSLPVEVKESGGQVPRQ